MMRIVAAASQCSVFIVVPLSRASIVLDAGCGGEDAGG